MNATMISEKPWWADGAGFFGHKYMEGDNSLEGYREDCQRLSERTQCEVSGVMQLLSLKAGDSVLDCPCGYGRHSIEMGRRGLKVVGADINSEHLDAARTCLNGTGNVDFVRQDMRFLTYSNQFDAVVNLFYSFGFFDTDEENWHVLYNFYHALKAGGRFMMHTDVNIPRVVKGEYKFEEIRNLPDGKQLKIIDCYDPSTKRMNGTWTLIQNNGQADLLTPYSVRVYTCEEFTEMCYLMGFKKVTSYGYWDGSPLTDDAEDMIVIAEK